MPRKNNISPPSSPELSAERLGQIPAQSRLAAYLQDQENDNSDIGYEHSEGSIEDGPNRLSTKHKRQYHAEHTDPRPLPSAGFLILHVVPCAGSDSHASHGQAIYLDTPRLYKGDSKASALRGQHHIEKVTEFLKKQSNINFVVYNYYSCENYHADVRHLFEPLPIPRDPQIPKSVMPFFFSLKKHGEPASKSSETMAILSEDLQNAIILVTGMSANHLSNLDKAHNMNMLQHLLYHYRRLNDQNTDFLDSVQRQMMDDLLTYMQWSHGAEYDEADRLFSRGVVTQKHLAKLYGPNKVLVTMDNGHHRAYMMEKPPEKDQLPLRLKCWSWTFEGVFQKTERDFYIDWPLSVPEDGEIAISSLEIYPLQYAPPEVEKQLRTRAEIFWRCRKRYFAAYNPPNAILEIQTTNPRYMIDMVTYRQMHGASDESSPPRDDLGSEMMDSDRLPKDPFPLLLPHEIYGFGVNDKKWRTLLVERIREINWNEEAFDRLVMQHHKKELIKALVTVHTTSTRSTDIIEGKGNALIILLHGGPGTGKTLTAESVAELTRKPLYRVTCGDIGTNADEVEKYLESVLLIGTIWGCVVLLDEADVFLEERRETDLQRNALVSVFLRVLEYYDGILVLTSNRIGTFDGAFKSRFQLAVHYPPLAADGRHEIWLNFINGLSKTNPDVDIDDLKGRIKELASKELNGRQIRNTVQTALQLAHFRKETLDFRHFDRVIKVVEEFESHIEASRGYKEQDWIQHQGLRQE